MGNAEDEKSRKGENRANVTRRMAGGKEKEQPTVVFRDMLAHHRETGSIRDNVR